MRRILLLISSSLFACASGPTLRSSVSGLGRVPAPRAVAVEVDARGDVSTQEAVRLGAEQALARGGAVTAAGPNDAHALRLHLRVEDAREPSAGGGDGLPVALPFDLGDSRGRLRVSGELLDDSGQLLGRLGWDAKGDPRELAPLSGAALAGAVDASATAGADPYVVRRASDQRLFLTPTALTLKPGAIELSNDEVLAFRFAVGLSHRVQLDLTAGALPIPLAAGGALPLPGAIVAFGGVGLALGTVFDAGLKIRVLDEGPRQPGLSISYDLVDVAASLVGAGGGAGAGGGGAAAAGGVGLGTVNLQFNLFTVAAEKHFGRSRVALGSYLLDNHHFLPQSADAAGLIVGTDGQSGGATTAGGSKEISRVPVQVQPFASYAFALGPHTLLGAEAFPWAPVRPVLGTTGARWTLGGGERVLGMDLERTTIRIDAALVWLYARGDPKQGTKSTVGYLPWLGLALAFD